MKLKRGFLIVIEGIDGAGKTTQAKALKKRLRLKSFDAVYFREPTKGKWGRKIKRKARRPDSISPSEELYLFIQDRRENVEKNLKPALLEKKIVILDRYYFSTIAYQGARGLDTEMIRRMNEEFVIKPDLVFILDLEAKKGLERISKRLAKDLLFEQEEYLKKVREIFKGFKDDNVFHIDGSKICEEITQEIEGIVLARLMNIV